MKRLKNELVKPIFLPMINDFKFNSVFFRNFRLILLMLVVPILSLLLVIYIYNNRIIYKEIYNNSENAIIKVKNVMDGVVDGVKITTLKLASDSNIGYLSGFDAMEDSYNTMSIIMDIQKRMSDMILIANGAIEDICIYYKKTNYFIAADSSGKISVEKSLHNIPISLFYNAGASNNYFTITRADYNVYFISKITASGEYRGTAVIVLDESTFSKNLNNLLQTPGSCAFIIDEDNRIISDSKNKYVSMNINKVVPEIGRHLGGGLSSYFYTTNTGKYMVSVILSGSTRWHYALVTPAEIYQKQINNERYLFVFLIVMSTLITLIVSWLVTYKLYRPIKIILQLLKDPKQNVADLESEEYKSLDEVGFISDSIRNEQRQNYLIKTELENKNQVLKQAQSVALQAQINPHFINNTLESINWKALEFFNKQNEISLMLNDLSKLLKISLDSKKLLVYISEEIEHAKLYVKLQKYRFKDRFSVEWDIDENVLTYKTVKISLQPVIENALSHGLKAVEKLEIHVECHCIDDEVKFIVKDNGRGINQETLDEIYRNLVDSTLQNTEHLGIMNINQRIQLIFGLNYGMKIHSTLGEGTEVIITIPKIQ